MSDPERRHRAGDLELPRQLARTRSFTCGRPRTPTVSPDGARVVFLRSPAGDDPVLGLWVLDVATGEERLVHDPHAVAAGAPAALTDAERARRERARERGAGVVAYATDRNVTRAVFVEGGRLRLADLGSGEVSELPTPGAPDDPRLDPAGRRVAFVVDGALHVLEVGGLARVLAADDEPDVRWGLAEFVAAEEMGRMRGHWWSPDGARLAACRVDERPVRVWWISDPADPASEPHPVRYPAAGTPNAIVTLHVFDVAGGASVDVRWDEPERFEYLARVSWDEGSPLTLLVQSRDQRATRVLEVDDATGATTLMREDADASWVELVPGAPARLDDGTLVTTVDDDGARRLAIGERIATPPGLDVASVVHAGADVVVTGSEHAEPTETHVWRVAADGRTTRLTGSPGVHSAAAAGDVVVLTSWLADAVAPETTVRRGGEVVARIASHAEPPLVAPRPTWATLGERELRAALLLPDGRGPDDVGPDERLPVLMAPYGGPHAREVQRSPGLFVEERFYADRLGVAVLVVDGRGAPGRGTAWEREIAGDFTVALKDQVDGLRAACERWTFLDPDRVAIMGWSFGGELSAFAAIDRPDVFAAAVVGAPVTDQRLYDTHYTERYLGMPQERPDAYERSSPISRAERLTRPILLIHGLADDNVVAAHTLGLSSRLFAAGIGHELVLLPKASHIGGFDELVVGRFLAVLGFLRRTLGLPEPA
ncbi:MAG TPA: prolyl oligopeptidase family serine peptidase [Actinomycetota bacterium]